jgi:hypothetical protein
MGSGVPRMMHSVVNLGNDAGSTRGRNTPLRGAARGLLFYLAPTIIFFIVDAIGLWRLPGDFWGMYGNDDGMWAAWNLRGIIEWSRPFDLAPFNPLSGMGSTFLPNTPWLNPAALALALPLPLEFRYLISYFVYFVELSLSLVLLFRVVGLVPLEALFCAQLYLLLLFPPTNMIFLTFFGYSLAPVNAHLVAICNLLLVLTLIAGRFGFWTNVLCGFGILFLLVAGIYSAPITFLTYAPVYAIAGVALLIGAEPPAKELGWKFAAILCSAALLWLVGFNDYLRGTSLISGRAALYPEAFAAGAELLRWHFWREAWGKFDSCTSGFFCLRLPTFYIFVGSSLGAALHLFRRSRLRPLAAAVLLIFAFIYAFDFASQISLFGSVHAIGPSYLIWSAYPFAALFLGLLILRVLQFVGQPLVTLWQTLRLTAPLRSAASTLAVALATLVIPGLALADWQLRTRFFQPPPPAHNPQIALMGQSSVRHAKIGAITRYLIEHARIAPGSPFRGYTATYVVDPHGPLWRQLQKRTTNGEKWSKLELYIAARPFFDRHYQNRLQETDLWEHDIPTLEEYGQWVTKSAYLALERLFNPNGKSNSGALRFNAAVFLHLYALDIDLLPFLGVRYLITDLQLKDPRATLRAEQSSDSAPPIFLYELADPNLGNWSPTKTVVAQTFDEAMTLARGREFDPSKTAIVFDQIDGPLVTAFDISFQFVRGGFRVSADADGHAAIVLPLQYSTCWRQVTSAHAAPDVALHRVNGFQTLLAFERHVDVTFEFAFGSFSGVGCRSRDVAELKSLGVN